jgi:hypothetical protein
MSTRHGAVLARLTELGLALAERVQAEAMAATGAEDLDRMSQAFHRVSRSVRMSMALEARLARAEREEARALARAEEDGGRELPEIRLVPQFLEPVPEGWRVRREAGSEHLAEHEDEDWGLDDARRPAARGANDTAAEAEAFAARVAHMKRHLKAEFGPDYAEAHAARRVAEEMAEEATRRADTS